METSKCRSVQRAILNQQDWELHLGLRAHVSECEDCRNCAMTLERLKQALPLRTVRTAEAVELLSKIRSVRKDVIVDPMQERLRAERDLSAARASRIPWRWAIVVAAVVTAAAFAFTPTRTAPKRDAIDLARYIESRVFGGVQQNEFVSLEHDADLRSEVERALGHQSSLVRRTAFRALSYSRVPIPAETTRWFLSHDIDAETLDAEILTAGPGDGSSVLFEARYRRHLATLRAVLGGLPQQLAQDSDHVDTALLLPYLQHSDAEVRIRTLKALEYVEVTASAKVEVRQMLFRDASARARRGAADWLVATLGDNGRATLREYIQQELNGQDEEGFIAKLGTSAESLDFARSRILRGGVDDYRILLYARLLMNGGEDGEARSRLKTSLASSDPRLVALAVTIAADGNWTEYREAVVEACRRADARERVTLVLVLADWDIRSSDTARVEEVLELILAGPDRRYQRALDRIKSDSSLGLSKRAREILNRLSEN